MSKSYGSKVKLINLLESVNSVQEADDLVVLI